MGGIGHNHGPPLDAGRSWRRYCWTKAKATLLPPAPLEVVRRRMRRAAELGLAYPTYASIVTITGRDIRAYLVTTTALGRAGDPLRPGAGDRLSGLLRCDVLLLGTPGGMTTDKSKAALGKTVKDAARVGPVDPRAPLPSGRDAIRALLAPHKLPGDTVAMIGAKPLEKQWSDAARLAGFLRAEAFFS